MILFLFASSPSSVKDGTSAAGGDDDMGAGSSDEATGMDRVAEVATEATDDRARKRGDARKRLKTRAQRKRIERRWAPARYS